MAKPIAEIGRNNLAQALTRSMSHCDVSEWLDESGKPVRIYWKPLTGAQQIIIDQGKTEVERVCRVLQQRALDADGNPVFAKEPMVSLQTDYDFDVIRQIVFLISTNFGQDAQKDLADRQEDIEKE